MAATVIPSAQDLAIAALCNLIRLMGAEMVAGRHRDDLDLFEQAVRTKIAAFTIEGCSPEIVQPGIALAASHVETALALIRIQALTACDKKTSPPSPIRAPADAVLH